MFFHLVLGKGFAVMVLAPYLQSPQKDYKVLLPVPCRNALLLGSGGRLLSFQGIPVPEVPS